MPSKSVVTAPALTFSMAFILRPGMISAIQKIIRLHTCGHKTVAIVHQGAHVQATDDEEVLDLPACNVERGLLVRKLRGSRRDQVGGSRLEGDHHTQPQARRDSFS